MVVVVDGAERRRDTEGTAPPPTGVVVPMEAGAAITGGLVCAGDNALPLRGSCTRLARGVPMTGCPLALRAGPVEP